MVTQVGYSVAGRSRGQMTSCAVCTVHMEMRSANFMVEPQNHGLWFVSGLASKPLGWFVSCLATKPVTTVSPDLTSKPVPSGFLVCASKLTALV
jgi:hypothetical protein